MISTDGMNSYTENKDLNKEILLWINNRIISLLERYIKQGDHDAWTEEYLCICFPRTFVEDCKDECVQILYDIEIILKDNNVYEDIRLLHKYVLIHLIQYYQELYEKAMKLGLQSICDSYFPPVENNLVMKIYNQMGYEFNSNNIEKNMEKLEEGHPLIFIQESLEDIDGLFWDDVFDDTEVDIDWIDQLANEAIDQLEWGEPIAFDLSYYADLMSRDVKERYLKIKDLIVKIEKKTEGS